jgi:hypothetical protein
VGSLSSCTPPSLPPSWCMQHVARGRSAHFCRWRTVRACVSLPSSPTGRPDQLPACNGACAPGWMCTMSQGAQLSAAMVWFGCGGCAQHTYSTTPFTHWYSGIVHRHLLQLLLRQSPPHGEHRPVEHPPSAPPHHLLRLLRPRPLFRRGYSSRQLSSWCWCSGACRLRTRAASAARGCCHVGRLLHRRRALRYLRLLLRLRDFSSPPSGGLISLLLRLRPLQHARHAPASLPRRHRRHSLLPREERHAPAYLPRFHRRHRLLPREERHAPAYLPRFHRRHRLLPPPPPQ